MRLLVAVVVLTGCSGRAFQPIDEGGRVAVGGEVTIEVRPQGSGFYVYAKADVREPGYLPRDAAVAAKTTCDVDGERRTSFDYHSLGGGLPVEVYAYLGGPLRVPPPRCQLEITRGQASTVPASFARAARFCWQDGKVRAGLCLPPPQPSERWRLEVAQPEIKEGGAIVFASVYALPPVGEGVRRVRVEASCRVSGGRLAFRGEDVDVPTAVQAGEWVLLRAYLQLEFGIESCTVEASAGGERVARCFAPGGRLVGEGACKDHEGLARPAPEGMSGLSVSSLRVELARVNEGAFLRVRAGLVAETPTPLHIQARCRPSGAGAPEIEDIANLQAAAAQAEQVVFLFGQHPFPSVPEHCDVVAWHEGRELARTCLERGIPCPQ